MLRVALERAAAPRSMAWRRENPVGRNKRREWERAHITNLPVRRLWRVHGQPQDGTWSRLLLIFRDIPLSGTRVDANRTLVEAIAAECCVV